jgi:hypothetical protein
MGLQIPSSKSVFDPEKALRTRAYLLLGLVTTLGLLFLGWGWPSIFTLLALPFVSAPILFLGALISLRIIRISSWVRLYLFLALTISSLSVSLFLLFLLCGFMSGNIWFN